MPIIVVNWDGFYEALVRFLRACCESGTVGAAELQSIIVADSSEEAWTSQSQTPIERAAPRSLDCSASIASPPGVGSTVLRCRKWHLRNCTAPAAACVLPGDSRWRAHGPREALDQGPTVRQIGDWLQENTKP